MYSLTAVGKVYANSFTALHEVSLTVQAGERIALIGPSGAGKTTLLRLLNCTLCPTRGTLAINGLDSRSLYGARLRQVRRDIATIYQQHNLVTRLRVMHNVLAGRLGHWSAWRALWSLLRPLELETAAAALQQVGLAEKIFQRTDQLSGGEQQRVAIARALVQNPTIILADEPVASLDPALSDYIVRLLVEIATTRQKTLIVSLHSVHLALDYFPRIIALQRGKVVFDGTPQGLAPTALQELFIDTPASLGTEETLHGRSRITPGCHYPA